ncbi:hypothetical protein NQD34_009289 [Periophthalmus magnuspinnatus]|nr:hypothetical protein NQD34_009289 [Periophthalmus magnuspinnatus]
MKLNEIPSVNMVSRVVLAGVLLVVAAVEANPKGGVRFWMNSVTLQCPEEGEWFYGNGTSMIDTNDIKLYYDYKYKGSKDQFHCKYKSQSTPDAPDAAETLETYYFYIQGNACENCLELDALVFARRHCRRFDWNSYNHDTHLQMHKEQSCRITTSTELCQFKTSRHTPDLGLCSSEPTHSLQRNLHNHPQNGIRDRTPLPWDNLTTSDGLEKTAAGHGRWDPAPN